MASKIIDINIAWPIVSGDAGAFQTNKTTLEAVASDLRILLMTNYGERPGQYTFGANLRHVLFEFIGGMTTANSSQSNIIAPGTPFEQAVKDSINSAVHQWMPFVTINKITLSAGRTSNEVVVKIEFIVANKTGYVTQFVSA